MVGEEEGTELSWRKGDAEPKQCWMQEAQILLNAVILTLYLDLLTSASFYMHIVY